MKGGLFTDVITYLVNIMTRGIIADQKLNKLQKGLDSIMATLEELTNKNAELRTAVANQGVVLSQAVDGIAEVRNDIAALKDQIGTGTPGITPEEADGVLAEMDSTLKALDESTTGLKAAADALTALGTEQ